MATQRHEPLWLVVIVESGIPACAEAYRDRRSAKRRECQLWKDMNENDDAVGVFQVQVGRPTSCVCDTASGAEFDEFAAQLDEA